MSAMRKTLRPRSSSGSKFPSFLMQFLKRNSGIASLALTDIKITKFLRIIGTEQKVEGPNGCERLVNPSFPDRIEATFDKDMICFKYNSIFTK